MSGDSVLRCRVIHVADEACQWMISDGIGHPDNSWITLAKPSQSLQLLQMVILKPNVSGKGTLSSHIVLLLDYSLEILPYKGDSDVEDFWQLKTKDILPRPHLLPQRKLLKEQGIQI